MRISGFAASAALVLAAASAQAQSAAPATTPPNAGGGAAAGVGVHIPGQGSPAYGTEDKGYHSGESSAAGTGPAYGPSVPTIDGSGSSATAKHQDKSGAGHRNPPHQTGSTQSPH